MKSQSIEERIQKLEQRNQRVELDKAWESSWARRIAIAMLTYLAIAAYLYIVIGIDPWLNALVPVVGFLLSTLTIRYLKQAWIRKKLNI